MSTLAQSLETSGPRLRRAIAAIVVTICFGCSLTMSAGATEPEQDPPVPRAPSSDAPRQSTVPPSASVLSTEQLAELARPSTLVIRCTTSGGAERLGTGFVVDPTGLIATNTHVVESCTEISVRRFGEQSLRRAILVTSSSQTDVAILFVPLLNAPALPLARTSSAVQGAHVLAVGNPEGLEFTVSDGIISAFRVLEDGQRLLQITAPISPGSSGGPLLDGHGQVVGMTTAFKAEGQNLNFAVISEDIRRALASLQEPSSAEIAASHGGKGLSEVLEPPLPYGGAVVGPPKPSYETVFVEGTRFVVGTAGTVDVWFSLAEGSDLEAQVMIVNRGAVPVTFDPKTIYGTAEFKDRKGKTTITPFYTYSAEEYEERLDATLQSKRIASAFAAAFGSMGRAKDHTLTGGDRLMADAIEREEAQNRIAQAKEEVEFAAGGLMRAHTLFPGKRYFGSVHFDKLKADIWHFQVKFGEATLEYPYTPARGSRGRG